MRASLVSIRASSVSGRVCGGSADTAFNLGVVGAGCCGALVALGGGISDIVRSSDMVLAVLVRVCYGGLRDVIYSNLEIKNL